jgi:hypothetical protein
MLGRWIKELETDDGLASRGNSMLTPDQEEANVEVRHRRKYKVTTNSNHKQPVFDNLVQRQFEVEQTDQVYAADISYIWTQTGWLYLAVVIDLMLKKNHWLEYEHSYESAVGARCIGKTTKPDMKHNRIY